MIYSPRRLGEILIYDVRTSGPRWVGPSGVAGEMSEGAQERTRRRQNGQPSLVNGNTCGEFPHVGKDYGGQRQIRICHSK